MKDLIEALTIIYKYNQEKYPICCEHGSLYIPMDFNIVSEEDIQKLYELGFKLYEEGFQSYRFGSC